MLYQYDHHDTTPPHTHTPHTPPSQDRGVITCQNPKADADDPPKNFTFDHVFNDKVTQKHVYAAENQPIESINTSTSKL